MRKPDLYLIRTTVNQILGAMLQVKLAPKRLGEAKREVDLINPTFPIISSYSRKTFICSVLFLRESYFKIICFMKKLYLYSSNAITCSEINATWGMGENYLLHKNCFGGILISCTVQTNCIISIPYLPTEMSFPYITKIDLPEDMGKLFTRQ